MTKEINELDDEDGLAASDGTIHINTTHIEEFDNPESSEKGTATTDEQQPGPSNRRKHSTMDFPSEL